MGGTRLAGLRQALAHRNRKEKTAGLAALALIASAPFGGLDRASEDRPAALGLDEAVAIGPYEVTFLRAYRVEQFTGTGVKEGEAPLLKPSAESRRLLIIEVDVTNDGKRPEYAHVLTKAVSIRPAAKTDSFGGPTIPRKREVPPEPNLIYRADASDTSSLNPGMTHHLALVIEQPAAANTARATVAIREMTYIGEGGGASNLDEDYWLHLDGTARQGTLRVGQPPGARA